LCKENSLQHKGCRPQINIYFKGGRLLLYPLLIKEI
jgi:hypothetical protein